MAERTGQSNEALQARLDALAQRDSAVADADRRLAEAVAAAHATGVEARQDLDRIEAEIERVVAMRQSLAADTPVGARELQRFLIAKQREILAVVTGAQDRSAAKTAVLQELLEAYRP